jgi:sec-independent protein translocase protein TatA
MFGNIGFPELLIILTIALLIFGPKKLPEIGKSVGKALREFKKTSDEIKSKIEDEIHADEIKSLSADIKADIKKEIKEDEEGKKIS